MCYKYWKCTRRKVPREEGPAGRERPPEGSVGRSVGPLDRPAFVLYQSRIGNDNYAVNFNQISVVYYHIYKYRIMYIYFYDSIQNDADHSLCRIFVTIKRWLIYMCYKYWKCMYNSTVARAKKQGETAKKREDPSTIKRWPQTRTRTKKDYNDHHKITRRDR